jgi:hypothetical protein
MAELTALFGALTDEQYTLYWQALHNWSDARMRTACAKAGREFVPTSACPFPTIAHLSLYAPSPEPYHRPLATAPQLTDADGEIPDEAWVTEWRASLPDFCKRIPR